ncbi:MAG: NF038129 family PEP-CTERM protein [Bryobacteraceae bacterium]|nr:NF038129 family PEP-CTERM protein [Bryobacteraceae bacterium]
MTSAVRTLCLLALLAGCAPAAYLFQMDTSGFVGNPSGPFSLTFSLVDGGGAETNTVDITDFNVGTGSLTGLPVLSGGAITIPGGFRIVDTGLDNRVTQTFDPGAVLQFLASFTTLPDDPAPDALSFSILDSNGIEVPTTGLGNTILYLELTPGALAELSASAEDPSLFDQPTFTEVPEPATSALLLFGGVLILRARRGARG